MKYYEILPTHTETPRNTSRKIANLYIEFNYHFLALQKKKSHYFWTGVYMYMAVRLLGFCVVYTGILGSSGMGLLPDTQNCSLRMHRECQERYPPLPVNDPNMHHGTCVTHVPWCMPGSLTSGFLWSRLRGKRSRHSRRMCNPQFCVSGKRPMVLKVPAQAPLVAVYGTPMCGVFYPGIV